jgi:linoleoyl-CoA desaturase
VTNTLYTTGRAGAPVPAQRQGARRSLAALPRRRWEPWRDWAVITLANHALLVTIALVHPHGALLLLAAVPLGLGLAIGTLTVLHDAGHRMYSGRAWPNVFAVQTSTPAGNWVGHWTLKHRVHHKLAQVYPYDEATRSSNMVRLHPGAPGKPWQRQQHLYAWALYGLAWLGELRSQLRYLRNGDIPGIETPPGRERLASFTAEKALCLLVLAPYAWVLGLGTLAILLAAAETFGSVFAAIVLVVGHINDRLAPTTQPPAGRGWTAHLLRTTASFSTDSVLMRWLTGGMTLHLAHHLRPVAVRSELPRLNQTVVRNVAGAAGLEPVVYATFPQAVAGHWRRLRDLGQPAAIGAFRMDESPA